MNKTNDAQHLDLLSISYYIASGVIGVIACSPLFQLMLQIIQLIGTLFQIFFNPTRLGFQDIMFNLIYAAAYGIFIVVGLVLAVCIAVAGRQLTQRKHYTFCFFIAIIMCVLTPLGVFLGILTLIVLTRSSVKELFNVKSVKESANVPQH